MDANPSHIDPQALAEETSAPPPIVPDQRSSAQRVFYGPFGLRAGWSLLIYLGILAVLGGAIWFVGHQVQQIQQQQQHTPAAPHVKSATAPLAPIVISESVVFGVFLLLSWLMAVIERRSLANFGLGGSRVIHRAVAGALWGLLAISALVATLYAGHLLTFDGRLDHGLAILGWGLFQLLAFFLVGLTEEYMFRGYLQFTLTRGLVGLGRLLAPRHAQAIAFALAAVLTSALFLFAHAGNNGEDKLGLFQVFLVGLLFLAALWRTGSLWWAIGFHTAWDWGQSFLYGVPDSGGLMQGRLFSTHASGNPLYSGGTVGPEGSILCVPIFLLMLLVVFFLTPAAPQPPLVTRSLDRRYLRAASTSW